METCDYYYSTTTLAAKKSINKRRWDVEKNPQNKGSKKSSFFLKYSIFSHFQKFFVTHSFRLKSLVSKKSTNISLQRIGIGVLTGSLLLSFFAIIWAAHSSFLLESINMYDEGVGVFGAKRFLSGEMPYRDFWTMYSPLKFPMMGGIFSFFGNDLFVARMSTAIFSLAGYMALFYFLFRQSHLLYAFLFTLAIIPLGQMHLTIFLLLLIIITFAHLLKNKKTIVAPYALGILSGMLFLLRIDFGGLTVLALLLLLPLLLREDKAYFLKVFLRSSGSFLAVLLVVFAYLGFNGAFSGFISQALLFPVFGPYSELRQLPWPALTQPLESISHFTINFLTLSRDLHWFFWILPVAATIVFWAAKWKQKQVHMNTFFLHFLLLVFVWGALQYATHRADFGHVVFLNILSLVLLFSLISQYRQKLWGLLFFPFVFLLMIFPLHSLAVHHYSVQTAEKKQYSFYRLPLPITAQYEHLQQVLNFFVAVPLDEKVFVATSDTSRVFVNNVMLSYLLDQPPATKYHELHTGIVTTAEVQKEIISELQDVKYIVIWDYFMCEPNKSCISSGEHHLDRYINDNFEEAKKIGKYQILIRKESKREI